MMNLDNTSLLLMVLTSACTFFLARKLGKRWRARREAERAAQAEQQLALQSRQVRRAAARRKKG
jgi:UPF0716 family protein affecting phage T7 exclusion